MKKSLKIKAKLYIISQVLSGTIFERKSLLQVLTKEAYITKVEPMYNYLLLFD
jgi:hypothetical protein